MMLLLLSVVVAVLWGEYYLLVQGVVVRGRQEGRDGGSSPGKKITEIIEALISLFLAHVSINRDTAVNIGIDKATGAYSEVKLQTAYNNLWQPKEAWSSL